MKKIFLTQTFMAVMAALTVSCEKGVEAEPDAKDAITIDFALDDDPGATRSTSTAVLDLDNGCTVAFYSMSSGNLLASGTCEGSTKRIVITSAPTENCYVHAVGNATFDWPNKQSELSGKGIPIDVTKGYIPRATEMGEYTWSVGASEMKISHMPKMYSRIKVSKKCPDNTDFTVTSARILNCPALIYPFGAKSTGSAGAGDTASSADLTLFGTEEGFELWVPSEGQAKIELTGTRTNGDGYNYTDTYTVTVDAIKRDEETSKTVMTDGEDSGDQIVVVIGEDTRTVYFEKSMLDVPADGTDYSTYVTGSASNGGKDWKYTLSWEGVSELAGNTTITIKGSQYDLGTSKSVPLDGDGKAKSIDVSSTYSGTETQDVKIYANHPNGESHDILNITFSKTEELHEVEYSFSFTGKAACGYKLAIYEDKIQSNGICSKSCTDMTNKTKNYNGKTDKGMSLDKEYYIAVTRIYGSTTATVLKYNGTNLIDTSTDNGNGSGTYGPFKGSDLLYISSGEYKLILNLIAK